MRASLCAKDSLLVFGANHANPPTINRHIAVDQPKPCNLQGSAWLEGFRPLNHGTPILGRVEADGEGVRGGGEAGVGSGKGVGGEG